MNQSGQDGAKVRWGKGEGEGKGGEGERMVYGWGARNDAVAIRREIQVVREGQQEVHKMVLENSFIGNQTLAHSN